MKEKKYLKITPPKGEGNIVVVPYSASTEAFYKARNKTFEEEKSDKRYKIEEATAEDIVNFNPSAAKNDVSLAEKEAADKAKKEADTLQAKLDAAEKAKKAAKKAAEKAEKEAADKAKNLEDQLKAAQDELKKVQDEKAKK